MMEKEYKYIIIFTLYLFLFYSSIISLIILFLFLSLSYAIDELGLDRDHVRQFGNLSRTQTWLDAIAAFEAAPEPTETEDISLEALADASATIVLPWEAAPEDSFITFWEAEPEPVVPQPLACLPELDEAWDEPAAPAPVVYPVVIALLMLWAILQLLLLLTGWIVTGLTALANYLDAAVTRRLETNSPLPERQSNQQDFQALLLASP